MVPAVRECIEQGGTVVTATRRLSRELRRQHDRAMVDSGRRAWESPDILPWGAWIRRCWDLGSGNTPGAPTVLTDNQLILVWQDVIRQDVGRHHGGESPLWNIGTTARAATGTLRLMRDWRIEGTSLPPSRHPDHAGFRRWLDAYERMCSERGWTDEHSLADRLAETDLPAAGPPLALAGFDDLTAQQRQLVARLAGRGGAVTVVPPRQGAFQDIPCHVFATPEEQWRAIAAWALGHLEESPDGRVAIVVPDLGACREGLVAALTDTLAPGQATHPGESRDLPFHVSLGESLASHPMARSLMTLLDVLRGGRINLEQSESLLLSPWISGHHGEMAQRGRAALVLRERLPWEHTVRDLASGLETLDCPHLSRRLGAALARRDALPARAPLAHWSTALTGLLDDLGWPGDDEALDSDLFQAWQSVREQVLRLGTLELVCGHTGLARAVGLLGQLLDNRTFQPEAGDARVQVLGIREAAGLEFDHTWFADLVEDRWPLPETPDPFLPVPVQREAGCPGGDPDAAGQRAAVAHARLAGSTASLVLSRAEREGDTPLIPSPLVADCPHPEQVPEAAPTLFDRLGTPAPWTGSVRDDRGPTRGEGPSPGGTGLIQRQSVCPRSAFLRDRLGAREHAFTRPGLDAGQRGTLVHRTLEGIWGRLGDSSTLKAMDDGTLERLILECIDRASAWYRSRSGCGDGFFRIQQEWLLETLREWFDLERHRTRAFTVIGREQPVILLLEGLELRFRIDRIDRFEDGSLALIDYKTGTGQSVDDWFHDRPQAPQLPLYALSQDHRDEVVGVVAHAWIRLGECVLAGCMDPDRFDGEARLGNHPGLRVAPLRSPPADGTSSHWARTLGALAREYLGGDARINPRNGGLCPDCPTPAFCRIPGNLPAGGGEAGDG